MCVGGVRVMSRIGNRVRSAGLVSLCLVCLVSAMRSFVAEYQTILLLSGTPGEVVARLGEGVDGLARPQAARTVRDLMSACGRVLTLAPQLKADTALEARVAASCRAVSQSATSMSPSNSRARAVALLSERQVSASELNLAQNAAPFEPWSLNVRLQAVARSASLPPDLLEAAAPDIARALFSDWGKQVVARLYRDRAELRPTIAAVAEKLPAADQRRFLGLLENTQRRQG